MKYENLWQFLQNVATIALLVLGPFSSVVVDADEWKSFQNGGDWVAEIILPTSWSSESGLAWSAELEGYGQSSPVTYKDSVYVTSVVGSNKESVCVQALKISDGSVQWTYKQPNSSPEKNTIMVSRAAPTPVVDNHGIVAFFEGGNLVALDHQGNVRWKRDLVDQYGPIKARHGIASSLEQDEKQVFIWVERSDDPYVMSVSKMDGSTNWKKDGLGATTWGSPRLVKVENEPHLVLSASGKLVAMSPEDGNRLWESDKIVGNTSSTPVSIGNGELLIGAGKARPGQKKIPSCGVLKVLKSGEGYSVDWKWASEKASCSFGSPIACNGKAYFVNRSGILQCHDLESGEKLFSGRLPCNQIWATPVISKSHVYFFGKNGKTSVLLPSNELDVVQTNELWKQGGELETENQEKESVALYAGIVAGSKILLRRGNVLYAVAENN